MSVSIPNFKSLMKKRNPFARTPLLIFTEYKPFQFLFDFLLCPFECSYPVKHYYNDDGTTSAKANLDIEIVMDMFSTIDTYDMAMLVSGDSDFERALQMLRARGKKFKVFSTAACIAKEIRYICGMHFIDFTDIREQVEKTAKPSREYTTDEE